MHQAWAKAKETTTPQCLWSSTAWVTTSSTHHKHCPGHRPPRIYPGWLEVEEGLCPFSLQCTFSVGSTIQRLHFRDRKVHQHCSKGCQLCLSWSCLHCQKRWTDPFTHEIWMLSPCCTQCIFAKAYNCINEKQSSLGGGTIAIIKKHLNTLGYNAEEVKLWC